MMHRENGAATVDPYHVLTARDAWYIYFTNRSKAQVYRGWGAHVVTGL